MPHNAVGYIQAMHNGPEGDRTRRSPHPPRPYDHNASSDTIVVVDGGVGVIIVANPSLVDSLEGIDEGGCDDGGGGKDGLMESDGLDMEGWDDGGASRDGWDDGGEGKDGLLESDGLTEGRLRSQALHVSRQMEDPGTQSRSC